MDSPENDKRTKMTGDSNGQVSLLKKTGPNESLRRERMKDFDDGGVA